MIYLLMPAPAKDRDLFDPTKAPFLRDFPTLEAARAARDSGNYGSVEELAIVEAYFSVSADGQAGKNWTVGKVVE